MENKRKCYKFKSDKILKDNVKWTKTGYGMTLSKTFEKIVTKSLATLCCW